MQRGGSDFCPLGYRGQSFDGPLRSVCDVCAWCACVHLVCLGRAADFKGSGAKAQGESMCFD